MQKDADYWARLHVESDRRKPIELNDRRGGRGINAPVMWRSQPKETEHGDAA